MYVCMYPCTSPLLPSISRKKKHGFSSVFAKRTSKNIEFFQIFGKRMQEAQASKKKPAGGIEPATPVLRHRPPPKNLRNRRRAGGGLGGGYPLSSSKYPTRRAMSADLKGFLCLYGLTDLVAKGGQMWSEANPASFGRSPPEA